MKRIRRLGLLTLCLLPLVIAVSVVIARSPQQATLFDLSQLGLRTDAERLADVVFGGGQRPEAWTGNTDLGAASFVVDLWFDNELLADAAFGGGIRPPGWISATSTDPTIVLRNVRHDLELTADAVLGEDQRPSEWTTRDPLIACGRLVMNLVLVLSRDFNTAPQTPATVTDYCAAVLQEINSEFIGVAVGAPDELAELPELILALRGDLERLADEELGLNNRPEGYIRNVELESQSLQIDLINDLQLLADAQLGEDVRPADWIESFSGSPLNVYRITRYNLEVLADELIGMETRLRGWQGAPLDRCDINLQNLVLLLTTAYGLVLPEAETPGPAYCQQVFELANQTAENPPILDEVIEESAFSAESRNAFAYLDPAATLFMGPLPWGVEFRAWYRNFGESTMMFVSGQDFAVYIDRRWTTLPESVYNRLPTLEGVRPLTFCDASWCNGPRATPTPTGSGPLLEIITGATPPATIAPEQVEQGGKLLVNWNNIRINYIQQFPDRGAAQVTLEICRTIQQIDCEPVVRVFNNATGFEVPVVSTLNGLNVYELPYGYTANLLIEGTTLFSTDVWLDDPTTGQ